ncbi:MAG: protein kinase domain-containing protein [Blastocatellia bacterium]
MNNLDLHDLNTGDMTTGRWREIESLFEAGLEIPTGARAAWLSAACAHDTSLRAQVAALLAADADANDFLCHPAAARSLHTNGHVAPETQIGPWRLVRELGRGGMGVVWLAARADGQFEQQAALKLIHAGAQSAGMDQRFRHERQILAALGHPNIARLLDGGVTSAGQPWFVMEYVAGVPLDEYCRTHALTLRQRLRLFLHVCAAVQHAHQQLIIHRDLKPGNILVTDEATPKLLDFGIAKLLPPDAAPWTDTLPGARPMTPAYASPEQTRGEALGAASDVYALGVILYELLTDASPYQLTSNSLGELSRAICEQEPRMPSARMKDKGERMKAESPHTILHPSSFTPHPSSLRGDLDAITLMALRKEAAARYPSVEQFAADIQRYLDGLPVLARRGATGYRALKFARRNRVPLAAAALIALSLLGGIAATLRQARIAMAAQTRAENEQGRAESLLVTAGQRRRQAEAARQEADQQRGEADAQRLNADAQRLEAEAQRLAAEARRAQAIAQTAIADTERTRAEQQELSNRRLLYISRMGLAQQAWEYANVGRARELLASYLPRAGEPDFRGFEWYYLWKLTHGELQTIEHPGEVEATRVSPDGKQLVTLARYHDRDNYLSEITVRDLTTWQILRQSRFPSLPSAYFGTLTSGGDMAALTMRDGTISLVSVNGGKETLRISDLPERAEQRGMGFSADGKLLAVGFHKGAVRLFDTATGRLVNTLGGHTSQVNHLTFSHDGAKLITGGYDASFILHDLATGAPDVVLGRRNQGGFMSSHTVFSPDGKTVVITGSGNLAAYDIASGTRLARFSGTGQQASYAPDGKTLAVAGFSAKQETVIELYDTGAWKQTAAIKGHGHVITSLSWLPDGQRIVSGSQDHSARLWDTRKIAGVMSVTDPSRTRGVLRQALLTPDGRRVLAGTGDQSATVWDANTGAELMTLTGHTMPRGASGDRFCVAVSPGGRLYATGGKDARIKLWDAETGREIRTLQGTVEIWAIAFSPDGETLASVCGNRVILWETRTGREIRTWSSDQSPITATAFLPDGASLLTTGQSGRVSQWQVGTGSLLREIQVSNTGTHALAISHDGRTLVTGSEDSMVHLWDLATGQPRMTFRGHSARVYAVALSPDGRRIASGGADKTVRLWDIATGQELFALRDHTIMIPQDSIAFAPDGRFLFTADWSGTMKFWQTATTPEILAQAR